MEEKIHIAENFDEYYENLIDITENYSNIRIFKLNALKTKILYKMANPYDLPYLDQVYNIGLELNKLKSDNIMYTFGRDQNGIYYEFIEGKTFKDAVETMSLNDIMTLYIKIVNITSYTYEKIGFVHGDLNPFNIIIRPDSTPVLIDFDFSLLDGYSEQFSNMIDICNDLTKACILDMFKLIETFFPSNIRDISLNDDINRKLTIIFTNISKYLFINGKSYSDFTCRSPCSSFRSDFSYTEFKAHIFSCL